MDAAFILANSYVNKVKKGDLSIIEGVGKIKNECWDNCQDLINSKQYLYDGMQFEEITGLWYEFIEINEITDWVKKSGKTLNQIKCEIEEDLSKSLINWQEAFLNNKLEEITNSTKNEL